jgi:CDP-diacylglycerol--serine O-phosphatidyltransferase
MMLSFVLGPEWQLSPWWVACLVVTVGVLMVSRVPTLAAKTVRVPRDYVSLALLGITILLIAICMAPWVVLPGIACLYVASIPVSSYWYWRLARGDADAHTI